jgi:hypothetical protein
MNDEFVSIEHLVLAIFNSKSKAPNIKRSRYKEKKPRLMNCEKEKE